MRNLSSVPQKISESILTFCHEINDNTPCFVDSLPALASHKGECFANVTQALQKDESSVYGWIIWQTSQHLLQAEFHCIRKGGDGLLTCITPYSRAYEQILFLPDPLYAYENKRVATRYKATSDAVETPEFIHALEALSDLEVTLSSQEAKAYINHPDNHLKRTMMLETMHAMEQAIERFEKMVLKGVGANSLCICGSGKKFKKCCGT